MAPEHFSAWADLLPDALLLVSDQGRILALNPPARALLGAAAGRRLADLEQGDPRQLAEYLRACRRSRQALPGALLLTDGAGEALACRCHGALLTPGPDPSERCLLLRLSPRKSLSSRFTLLNDKIAELTREVARRRRVEADLEAQRGRLQITLDSIGDAVIVTDPQSRIVSLNPVAGRLTGWGQAAVGRPLDEVFRIINEKTRAAVDNPVTQVLSRGTVVGLANHTLLIDRDGGAHPIDDSAAPIRAGDGTLLGVVLVFRDISAARLSERRLRNSNERLQLALNAGRMGTWEWDIASNRVTWSATLEAIHGLAPGSFPGTFDAFQADIHPDDRERVLDAITQALAQRRDHFIEYRLLRPDGQLRWVEARGRLFSNEDGQPVQMAGVCMDITERKQAEQQLREQTRIAETLNLIGRNLAGELDLQTLVQMVTDACTTLVEAEFGAFFYNGTAAAGTYTLYALSGARRESFSGFPMPRDTPLFASTFRGEGVVRLDDVTRDPRYGRNPPYQGMPSGHLPVKSYLAVPVISRSGEVLGGLFFGHGQAGIFEEADERLVAGVAAQAAVAIDNARLFQQARSSEQRFRELADSMPQIVFTAGPDGRLDYCNQRWHECFGMGVRTPDGAPGWEASLHPDDIQPCLDGWRHSVETGQPFQIQYRLLDRHGAGYRWHLGRAIAARDETGKILRWYGTSTDIDEQKRAEHRIRFLAEASATLADLVDYESTLQKVARLAVPDFADWCAVDILDADGALRQLAVAHADPSKIDLARQLESRYPVADNQDAPAHRVLESGVAERVEDIPDSLLQTVARDAGHLDLLRGLGLKSYICLPLHVKGRRFGALTFVCAESGYRYTEKDLALAEDLARRASIALENARLYREVKDADRRKDEFLAMLAHELRNPLAPIRTGLDLLGLQPQPRSAMETEIIDLMKTQVQHMVRLVDDLLDVSRIMRGKSDLKKEPVDLARVLEQAVKTVRPLIDEHRQELTITLPEPPIELHADPVRLAQVIGNLLHNAAKYTNRGGHIWLSAQRHGPRAEIRVRDDGLGIEPELLPHVFDLFTQSRRSMDRSQGGLGIGLTVARSLVEMHGGTLTAHSGGSGAGSEFVVRLPIQPTPALRPAPEQPAPAAARACILVVDDNADVARTQQLLLSKLGPYHVHTAHDGPSALRVARRHRPDMILLDIGLPGMNGYEVARQVRQDPLLQNALLVALTGYGQPEDRRRSREAGFDEHLIKPPSLADLRGLLAHPKLAGRGGGT